MITATTLRWLRDALNRQLSDYPSDHSHQKFYFYDPLRFQLMLNCGTIQMQTHLMLYCSHRLVMSSVVKPTALAGYRMIDFCWTWARLWGALGRYQGAILEGKFAN